MSCGNVYYCTFSLSCPVDTQETKSSNRSDHGLSQMLSLSVSSAIVHNTSTKNMSDHCWTWCLQQYSEIMHKRNGCSDALFYSLMLNSVRMILMSFMEQESVTQIWYLGKRDHPYQIGTQYQKIPLVWLLVQCQEENQISVFPNFIKAHKYPKPATSVAMKPRCRHYCHFRYVWERLKNVALLSYFGCGPHASLDSKKCSTQFANTACGNFVKSVKDGMMEFGAFTVWNDQKFLHNADY